MNIELFVLCDAATDQHGKLNILGAFDNISVRAVPFRHPACSIVSRTRFKKSEEGEHQIKISIIDVDGNSIGPKPEGKITVQVPDNLNSTTANLIINLQGLEFKQFGCYQIDFSIDGNIQATLPLNIRQVKQK